MVKQLLPLCLVAFIGTCVLADAGCKHPYSGKPERLSKPRKKKRKTPKPEQDIVVEEKFDDKCRTNFYVEPKPIRSASSKAKDARSAAVQADRILIEAERTDKTQRAPIVTDAISRLSNALRTYPYAPLPTFKLAVAYALVDRKACALSLLERLKSLQQHPPVEKEARRVVQQAARDAAFERFRNEATAALGL